jgi:uncharacterized membrane protein YozB (DUF420 family)
MATWAKIVIRVVGVLNSAVLLLGVSFLAESVYKVATGRTKGTSDEPYFYVAFATMAAIEIVFICIFLLASFRFVRGNLSAIHPYSIAVLLYVVYVTNIGLMWRLGGSIGESIAAATGISSGTVLFAYLLFFVHPVSFPPFPLYPALTVALVQLVKWRGVQRTVPVRA